MGSMLRKGFEPSDLNWVLFDARNHSLSIRGDAYRHQFRAGSAVFSLRARSSSIQPKVLPIMARNWS
jgi:hypothetical protein